jgi:hypothetical protein
MQTYSTPEYKKQADIIHNLLMYGIGDNWLQLKNMLSLIKNNDDAKKLIEAYGFKQNYVYSLPVGVKENLLTNLIKTLRTKEQGVYSDALNFIREDWNKKKIKFKI